MLRRGLTVHMAKMICLQSIWGKAPKNCYIQGTGNFISPSICFNTPHYIDQLEKKRAVFEEWFPKYDANIEKIWQEIRKRPRHSNIGSSNEPMDDACMHDADNMEINRAAAIAEPMHTDNIETNRAAVVDEAQVL